MGKISKYANLYNKNGDLIRSIDPKTNRLKDFSIKELEEYMDTLDKGSVEYRNCMSWLIGMYQNPRTEEDRQYVQKLQQDLIKKLQDVQTVKKQRKEAGKVSLEQLENDIEDAEIIGESVPSDDKRTSERGDQEQ